MATVIDASVMAAQFLRDEERNSRAQVVNFQAALNKSS